MLCRRLLSKRIVPYQSSVGTVSFLLGCIALQPTQQRIIWSRNRGSTPAPDIDIYEETSSNEFTYLQENDNPENLLECRELELLIQETVQDLEPDLRSAITLREHAGLSYEQIAQIMDCPVGTVRSRIFRARASISNKIREREAK